MQRQWIYTVLAVAVLALAVVPIGTAVFVLGFVYGDSPCVMCWEQRIAMALIALIGLFVLRYGPRPRYVGLSILVAGYGAFMSLRHTAMHASRDIGQGFSLEILGAHTYTWALFVFWAAILMMGALLMAVREGDAGGVIRKLRPLEKLAAVVFLVVIAGNLVQAFASTGPPPFMGQGDPVRFSFNPAHWVWSLEEYSAAPVGLRGRWAASKPDASKADPDPSLGPFVWASPLKLRAERTLGPGFNGTPTGLDYEEASDRFLLTTEDGVYLADGALARPLRHTIVDVGYSADLARFAGAAFLEAGTVMAVSDNKSFVILRESDKADASKNFRYFRESFDRFDEVRRGRFGTVRARMMYVKSAAYDPARQSIYTVTVPNERNRGLVISRFDRRDLTLSEEFVARLSPEADVRLLGERTLDELFVTAAAVRGGRLFALSAAYSTLLEIDLDARAVVGARTVPGLSRPAGIAFKGDELWVVTEEGKVLTFDLTQAPRPASS
ncbi:MAG TPA: disulfide bond formation protein B [Vicinamibacterales bacterium]|nr:disulfide bond formation protein B [Vicinamibacterales bacterium]